ncbi:hypothetical protein [Nonomuraea sp. CA-141351]|uniref:hypothetical protein n=1 Tax=Nonomuraea sp. CA-141351 TaxID=3239996 RepID=UPI003D8EC3B9
MVRILQQLPQYLPRLATELLGRTAQLDELGRQVSTVPAGLPVRTLDAPSGAQDDAEFERRHLEHDAPTARR